MKASELIRWAMQMSDQGVEQITKDMHDAALTFPTPGAKGGNGNHPLWTIGHLAYIEGGLGPILLGEDNPVEHWGKLFGTGTLPMADASAYPSFDEVLSTFHRLRARNLKLLDEIGEAGLDRIPKNIPPGLEDAIKTFGHTLLLIALHSMAHYGQIADARRVVGRKPLM